MQVSLPWNIELVVDHCKDHSPSITNFNISKILKLSRQCSNWPISPPCINIKLIKHQAVKISLQEIRSSTKCYHDTFMLPSEPNTAWILSLNCWQRWGVTSLKRDEASRPFSMSWILVWYSMNDSSLTDAETKTQGTWLIIGKPWRKSPFD